MTSGRSISTIGPSSVRRLASAASRLSSNDRFAAIMRSLGSYVQPKRCTRKLQLFFELRIRDPVGK